MSMPFFICRRAYTIVELMVTVVIVAVLTTTVGTLFVKLLTIQEREREEGYVRERLAELCATYADYMSVGSSVSNIADAINPGFVVTYRHETGGVSLETGRVSNVAHLQTAVNTVMMPGSKGKWFTTLDLDVVTYESTNLVRKFSRKLRGDDTPLIPIKELRIKDSMVNLGCTIRPLGALPESAALWYLQVVATYDIENGNGEIVTTNAIAGRVVRLWNRE